jgi:multiple antibiotic resistance protein
MAISMMHGPDTPQVTDAAKMADEREAIAIFPLSVPLLAGPGAISSMIIAAQQGDGFWWHIWLVIPIAIVAALVWGILMLSFAITDRLGNIGIIIVTRLMGLILAAMAIEFMAHGLGSLFPGLLN